MAAGTRSNEKVQIKLQNPDTGAWVDMGQWAVLEGGNVSSEVTTYHDWDGPQKLGASRDREDITVRRLFGRHTQEVLKTLDGWVSSARAEISRVATNGAGVVQQGAEVITYTGLLSGAGLSGVEKGSSEGREIELTFAVDAALA